MEATPQIFLSYAREDEERVEELYQKLSVAGFKPWMDRKDILPGERWDRAIRNAIRRSDFFLVCLSANSVRKRGGIYREIKQALDIWQEKLEDDIYLIPIRLDDCELPESLSHFQWLDLFEADGWTQLVKAILAGMKRRERVPATIQRCKTNLINGENANSSARELGDIAIIYQEKEVIYALWEAICKTNNLPAIIGPCAFTIGRIVWEPSEPPLEIENICFDIFEKSIHTESELIIDKFAYTVGKIALEAKHYRIRQRAKKFVNTHASSPDPVVRDKYTYTKNRISSLISVTPKPIKIFWFFVRFCE